MLSVLSGVTRFNKATASALAGAAITAIGAFVALDQETLGAIQTLLVTALVYFIPNKE